MNELTCAAARDMASDLIDHELSASDQAAVQAHVAGCPTCPGLYRALVALHEELIRRRMDGVGLVPRPPLAAS